jgi:hypothetical protein
MRMRVYTTADGVEIYVEPGKKSEYDFRVRYKEPNKALRTPKHIHLIIDLYLKKTGNRDLTLGLVSEFLEMLKELKPSVEFPPKFQAFSKNRFERFKELDAYGEYSVEFLAAIFDLIMIQEKTNYPNGIINRKLFEAFLAEKDIFSVVSAATFRGA